MVLQSLEHLKNCLAEEYEKQDFSHDVRLPNQFKKAVKTIDSNVLEYDDYSVILKSSSDLTIIFPNQWLYIAAFFCEYYTLLQEYKKAVYRILNLSGEEGKTKIKSCLNNVEFTTQLFDAAHYNEEDRDYLIKFLSSPDWWGGGKGIERGDFYVSPILNLAKLVNASQSYVADLCRFLAENPQYLIYLREGSTEEGLAMSLKKNHINESLQLIYYGAPGTGKSHKTDEVASKFPETVRTTFHPDSDYSTFVGAYKPIMSKQRKCVVLDEEEKLVKPIEGNSEYEEKITYKFVKQAFLKAYVKAWKLFKESCEDGKELAPQFLVIEEINRGNCAQIFGDLFQLLDRKQNFSEYPIEADDDIRKSLLEIDTRENPSFGESGLQLTPEQIAYINQVFDKTDEPSRGIAEKICNGQLLVLPPNLYIWATMNTSDQSLFPIDSAFKRRWEWKYVRISEGKKKETKEPLNFRIKFNISDTESVDESWWEFIQKINEIIEEATKSEDKKLGYFFCKPDKKANATDKQNTIISAETFVGKVVFYLWQDVFKDYGFKSDIFKKEDNKRLAFHDFYPHDIEPDEEKNPEGIDLKLVKKFIFKVMGKKSDEK